MRRCSTIVRTADTDTHTHTPTRHIYRDIYNSKHGINMMNTVNTPFTHTHPPVCVGVGVGVGGWIVCRSVHSHKHLSPPRRDVVCCCPVACVSSLSLSLLIIPGSGDYCYRVIIATIRMFRPFLSLPSPPLPSSSLHPALAYHPTTCICPPTSWCDCDMHV